MNDQNNAAKGKEIIVVTVEMGAGGAERVLTELMEAWACMGNKVTLVQTRPNIYSHSYNLAEEVENIGIQSKRKSKVTRYAGETIALLRLLKHRPNATVVAFANASIRIVGVCSFFTRNRIVFSERCDPRYTPDSSFMRWIRDKLFCLADVCVFQTEQAKKLFPRKAQERGVVIPNPVNPHLPPPFDGERRKTIITACRLAPQKNLPMLIDAFAKLTKEYPDYSLEIYGTGDDQKNLQALIEQIGISDNAKLMGHTLYIHQAMRDCAMYVCSSDYEGLSNSIIEAMALGLPIISTDHPIGGAREMITDQVDGLLVPLGDVDAMYAAMKYIIENPDKAREIGHNAQMIRDRWQADKIAAKWIELF